MSMQNSALQAEKKLRGAILTYLDEIYVLANGRCPKALVC